MSSAIVVADTSVLNYLILIDHIQVLPQLFKEVFIPHAVVAEMQNEKAPQVVRVWSQTPPSWLNIASVLPHQIPGDLASLGNGEREAIALALHIPAHQIALDDALARDAARSHGLELIGTIGILRKAADQKLLDLEEAFAALVQTGFRAHKSLLET